jgi:NAD(P)-dependent dehydrogenase (short-subunit alcohol dehydrogenase family)
MGENLDALAATFPSGRPAQPEEIVEAITFLASPRSSFIHGTTIHVDGGRWAI